MRSLYADQDRESRRHWMIVGVTLHLGSRTSKIAKGLVVSSIGVPLTEREYFICALNC